MITGFFKKLQSGLARTSSSLSNEVTALFTRRKLDDEMLQSLKELLIRADLGNELATRITAQLKAERFEKDISPEEVKAALSAQIEKILSPVALPFKLDEGKKPHVVLVIGVNGTGKTTTIGKLASILTHEGKKVMLAAGDTFRAAAIEQLKIWGARTNAEVVSSQPGADAAGLAYEALEKAQAQHADALIIDTAGRLQNKTELMAELEKMIRVLKKRDASAPHSVILTLDATTGQNALSQAELFGKAANVTGLVMTKLDGTARGGILVALSEQFKLPVHFVGVGEGIDDLEQFSAQDFAKALVGLA
jgi:fused signal recognition particle receptor